MKTAKEIAITSVFVALLIGGQFALNAISGVEVVTVLAVTFFFCFGEIRGCIVATVFSILRCLLFGFFPSVVILYLVYYNLLAVVFGFIGKLFKRQINIKKMLIIVIVSVLMTVCFTIFDNVITPLFYGFTKTVAKAYFVASITTMLPQLICVAVTVSLLFYPLYKIFRTIKI